MKTNKMLLWAFIVSACITIVQLAMVAMGAGEVAWIGTVMVAVLTVITAHMVRGGIPPSLAWFTMGGALMGSLLRFGDPFNGLPGGIEKDLPGIAVVCGLILAVWWFFGWAFNEEQSGLPLVYLCHSVAVLWVTIVPNWKLIATWATILLVAWLVVRAKEAREEVEGLLRS